MRNIRDKLSLGLLRVCPVHSPYNPWCWQDIPVHRSGGSVCAVQNFLWHNSRRRLSADAVDGKIHVQTAKGGTVLSEKQIQWYKKQCS